MSIHFRSPVLTRLVPRSFVACLGRQLCEEAVAGLLTGPAGLGTDATMLHAVLRMPLALVATEPAGGRACLEGGPNQLRFERRLPRHHAAGRIAQIGAVEIE